jgi:prolyl-tRNA editing enzyme YbaK/EbsC (Cys-tRNA(Pro) deacylase)
MSEAAGSGSIERVRAALREAGLGAEIKEFRAKASNRAVLVVASGVNRVDEKKLNALLGEKVGKADADFVRAETGFAIGGVAPVGHGGRLSVFIDQDLNQYAEIWAAAGSPNAVFKLTPADLLRLTGGKFAALKQD